MRKIFTYNMVSFVEPLARDVIRVGDDVFVVDTCKTPDAGWETGISKVDIHKMYKDIAEEWGDSLTEEEVIEHANDYTGDWEVQNYRNKREALAGHKRVCKSGKLDDEETWHGLAPIDLKILTKD